MSSVHTIILADNQAIFRAGIARVLRDEADMRVAALCEDASSLQDALSDADGDIVLFPSSMDQDAHAIVDWIEARSARAIMILEHGHTAEQALQQRLNGLLLRSANATQLLDCIRRVAAGERTLQASAATDVRPRDHVGEKALQRLTPREIEIIALVTHGAKNREIADRLQTKEQVVKNYLRSIFDKIGVSDRLELALYTVHHPALSAATEHISRQPRAEN